MDSKAILRDIKAGNFQAVYLLHGEEPYFIDELSNAIEKMRSKSMSGILINLLYMVKILIFQAYLMI